MSLKLNNPSYSNPDVGSISMSDSICQNRKQYFGSKVYCYFYDFRLFSYNVPRHHADIRLYVTTSTKLYYINLKCLLKKMFLIFHNSAQFTSHVSNWLCWLSELIKKTQQELIFALYPHFY